MVFPITCLQVVRAEKWGNQTSWNYTGSLHSWDRYGVTYTNTTGKPIMVYFGGGNIDAITDIYGYINNVLVSKINIHNANGTVNLLVPDGSTYKYTLSIGLPTINIQSWFEIR